MQQKILLVGNPRICPQVAYVMDWQDFKQVKRLTDAEKYRDYKIVVCAFKRRSGKLVKVNGKGLNLIYLDEVCRELDEQEPEQNIIITKRPHSWLKRRAVALLNHWRPQRRLHSRWLINRLPVSSLRLSELFLKVLYSPPTNIKCDKIEQVCHVYFNGDICGCASGWVVPFGNLYQQSPNVIFHSPRARIIKLSSLNRSYCLCDLNLCLNANYMPQTDQSLKPLRTAAYPSEVILATDRSCNLQCLSCRQCHYTADATEQQKIAQLTRKLVADGWLSQPRSVTVAGQGEVFYSPNYRALLPQIQTEEIHILSNGTLFNAENWRLIAGRFKTVHAEISIDAATPATYQKLRGGDFAKLLANLQFLAELRRRGQIAFLQFNFVVQKSNYREMLDFIELGKKYGVDRIYFLHLNNWSTFDAKTYAEQCLIIDNRYLDRDFYEYLQNPLFNEPLIDLRAFTPYLANSAKRYGTAGGTDDKKRQ